MEKSEKSVEQKPVAVKPNIEERIKALKIRIFDIDETQTILEQQKQQALKEYVSLRNSK